MSIKLYIDPTSGNDANDGLTLGASVQTLSRANTIMGSAVNYEWLLLSGNHVLSADLTIASYGMVMQPYSGATPIITGNFRFVFSGSNTSCRFKNITFRNFFGTNGSSGYITAAASAAIAFQDCIIDGASYSISNIYTSGKNTAYNGCIFKNLGATSSVTGSNAYFKDCTFMSPQNTSVRILNSNISSTFIGCLFKDYAIIFTNSYANSYGCQAIFRYCTFDLKDARGSGTNGDMFNSTLSSGTYTDVACIISNSIFTNCNVINNVNSGTLIVDGPFLSRNCIETSTCTNYSNFAGIDSITTTNIKFYDQAAGDYRLEIESPASIENNGFDETVGAYELAKPSTFYTTWLASQIKSGDVGRQGSRVNNIIGTLAGSLLSQALVKIGSDRGDGALGTYDGSERYTDLSTSLIPIGTDWRYNSLTNNRTGLRAAIYNLLSTVLVKIGIDRGDGQLGSYVAAERYTNAGVANVRKLTSYQFNSETPNQVGELDVFDEANLPAEADVRKDVEFGEDKTGGLDIDAEANLPEEETVLIGSPNFGKDEDKIPSYDPDFADPANLLEIDTSNNEQGLIPMSKVPPSLDGTYLGEESNSNIEPTVVLKDEDYLNLGEEKTGLLVGSDTDPKYVLFPMGTLGQINSEDQDIAKQLTDNARLFMGNLLGSDWQELMYFKEVEKNDAHHNFKQWGIRPTNDYITNEKVGNDTVDLEFEIKLTTDFENHEGDDNEREQELMLIDAMEGIRRQLRSTKFFKAQNIRIVRDFRRDEVVKYGTNGLLCRATVLVNLNIKNA